MNRIFLCGPRRCEPYYAVLQTESGFWFHRLEGEEQKRAGTAVFSPGPGDMMIERDQIISKRLTMYAEHERDYGLHGSIMLYTADQACHEFFFGKYHVQELRRFFGLTDEETVLPERKLDYGKSLPQQEQYRNLCLWLYVLCFALDLAVLLGAAFLPYLPWLILSLAATFLPAALALLFPAWYTLTRRGNDSRHVYGRHMYRMLLPLYFPPIFMLFRLPQVTYLPGPRVMICALPVALASIAVWILSPERRAYAGNLGLVLTVWTVLGCGVGLVVNAADSYLSPPDRTEVCRVAALECDTELSDPPCYVTVDSADGELRFRTGKEYYDLLSVGDPVTVSGYDGTLGIPFACLDTGWG